MKKRRWRYLPLYLLIAITTVPIVAAYVAYYVASPSGRTNYGALIEPQRRTPVLPATKISTAPPSTCGNCAATGCS